MSGIQFLAGLGMILLPLYPFDRSIRTYFGVEKADKKKAFLTRYEKWVKVAILLFFAFITFQIGMDSPYLFLVVILLTGTLYGFEAILQKKYSENSKEYKVTLIQGGIFTVLMMVLIFIFNLD
ncbi:DUF4181 domain-containing protein [Bacillus massiliigorillae]|uniref:DUF4181 domain-containing protein n=1 Tax=Bacillus massiliigorillae TaxID=1243664 RepID=UPI0003AAAC77|nr:DUF4181 domain-containing protein [Bacillus massiliigorillae]